MSTRLFARASTTWRPIACDQIAQHRRRHPPYLSLCPARPTSAPWARPSRGPGSADGRVWRGERRPSPGVVDDRSDNRVLDMDEEGSDVHFLVPSVWTSVVGLPDVSLEIGLIRAYHRFMHEFCGPFPDRLKGPIVASTRDVGEAVREIREWGKSKWAVAVQPLARQRSAGRSPRSRTDLARRRGARSGDRPSQLYVVAALFPRLRGHVGQCLPGAALLASLGSDAVYGRFSRRRHPRPPSGPAALRARMRLRLAAVLGAADGRAGQLCRPHRQAQAPAERAFRRRAGVLQHRGARARADVQHGHRRPGDGV